MERSETLFTLVLGGGVKVEVALGVALKDRCAYHLSVEKTGMLPVNSNSTGNKI